MNVVVKNTNLDVITCQKSFDIVKFLWRNEYVFGLGAFIPDVELSMNHRTNSMKEQLAITRYNYQQN